MENLRPGLDGRSVRGVDVLLRVDHEGEMVQAWGIQLERLLVLRLAQPDRAGADGREPQVVDLLAALALDEERRLEPERSEHRRVERERALEIAADEVDVTQADEHDRSVRGS